MSIENPTTHQQEFNDEKGSVQLLLHNLETGGYQDGFSENDAQKRKDLLERIAKQLPTIGNLLLHKFRELIRAEQLDIGDIAFYSVGGRVRGTPIGENTDFDVLISSEKKLTPFAKEPTITFEQRHRIARTLYEEVERIFNELGLGADYEKGILEFKGFGENNAEEVEKVECVLKIVESRQ